MDPVTKSLCTEKHAHVDERCQMHGETIDKMEGKVSCILKMQMKLQWILITTLVALIIDIVRGFYVLDTVLKGLHK